MSARVVLRQQLEEAARVLHHERRQRRRASRRERAQHQRCLVRSKERSKLLATVALRARCHNHVVGGGAAGRVYGGGSSGQRVGVARAFGTSN